MHEPLDIFHLLYIMTGPQFKGEGGLIQGHQFDGTRLDISSHDRYIWKIATYVLIALSGLLFVASVLVIFRMRIALAGLKVRAEQV